MVKKEGSVDVVGGIRDFVILVLLLVAAAGGGYLYGSHQKLAPVEYVPANTPGAVKPAPAKPVEPEKKPDQPANTQPPSQP